MTATMPGVAERLPRVNVTTEGDAMGPIKQGEPMPPYPSKEFDEWMRKREERERQEREAKEAAPDAPQSTPKKEGE